MELNKLLEEIKKQQVFAEEDVNSGPPETLVGRRGRQFNAVEALKRLRREYANELRASSIFIMVTGDKAEEFSKIASESFKCFSADPESYYVELAEKIPQEYYVGREGISNLFDVLGRHIEDKMLGLDVIGYPQLIFKEQYRRTINSKQDFVDLIKRAINEQIGGEIVGLQTIAKITDAAIKREHTGKTTPIVLASKDERFILTVAKDLERIAKRVYVVGVGEVSSKVKQHDSVTLIEELSNDSVKKALKTINSTFKK